MVRALVGFGALFVFGMLVSAWTCAQAQDRPPPILVVRLTATADAAQPGTVNIDAELTPPNGGKKVRRVRSVVGQCIEDVGGMESLSVVRCDRADGATYQVEINELRGRVFADEFVTQPGGERRRTQHRVLMATRRGWIVTPRCVDTFDDAHACPPSLVAVPDASISVAACNITLEHTTYDEQTRAPDLQRHIIRRLEPQWGESGRERDWSDIAPVPHTLAAARRVLTGAEETTIGGRTMMIAQTSAGSLSYRFDELGRTDQVTWDPQADSSTYVYTYRYVCRDGSSTR